MQEDRKQLLSESGPANVKSFKDLLKNSEEGHVLIVGISLTFLYVLWLAIQLVRNPSDFQTLLGMTTAEIIFGRIACMGIGYSVNMSHLRVISICMFLETLLVLIFYPLFVFTWRQLLALRWLNHLSRSTRTAAERHKEQVRKYGVIGLFIFVWLPFWMTGPVVGCMIGYLLGMRVWINLVTVLSGTYVAILAWAYLLHKLHQKTLSYSSYAIVIIAVIVTAAVLIWMLRQRFKNNHKKNK